MTCSLWRQPFRRRPERRRAGRFIPDRSDISGSDTIPIFGLTPTDGAWIALLGPDGDISCRRFCGDVASDGQNVRELEKSLGELFSKASQRRGSGDDSWSPALLSLGRPSFSVASVGAGTVTHPVAIRHVSSGRLKQTRTQERMATHGRKGAFRPSLPLDVTPPPGSRLPGAPVDVPAEIIVGLGGGDAWKFEVDTEARGRWQVDGRGAGTLPLAADAADGSKVRRRRTLQRTPHSAPGAS